MQAIRKQVRKFVEEEVVDTIHPYVEQAKFPEYLIPKLQKLDPLNHFLSAPYGNRLSLAGMGFLVSELARGDAGVCTMVLVQYGLVAYTI